MENIMVNRTDDIRHILDQVKNIKEDIGRPTAPNGEEIVVQYDDVYRMYVATLDSYDGGDIDYETQSQDPMGMGNTEEIAIQNLIDNMDYDHDVSNESVERLQHLSGIPLDEYSKSIYPNDGDDVKVFDPKKGIKGIGEVTNIDKDTGRTTIRMDDLTKVEYDSFKELALYVTLLKRHGKAFESMEFFKELNNLKN